VVPIWSETGNLVSGEERGLPGDCWDRELRLAFSRCRVMRK